MIPRTSYIKKLLDLKDKNIIKVITGIRRSGKSTILKLYKENLKNLGVNEERIVNINFEDNQYRDLLDEKNLYDYITSKIGLKEKYYIILDEIQSVKNFERCVNSLFLRENVDIYITGSNSYMLSGELATFLTGRYMQIHVLPLSFKEFLSGVGEQNEMKAYEKYLKNGGLPYILNLDDNSELIRNYLDSIYSTVVIKDIVSKRNISDVNLLESITRYLFDNVGSYISIKKISDTLTSMGRKNSVSTIENYVSSLLESYIMYKVNRYDIKGKQHLKTLEKYYLSDLGLRTYLLGNKKAGDMGHLLENVVFLELKRKGYEIYVGKNNDMEVDFVIINQDGLKYIQVALSVRSEKTLERELRVLKNLNDNYPKYILTLDYDTADYDGIKQFGVIDFLLERENI